ncbi:tRNA(Ile)-lysidine synthase [Sediminihabitans luteus]|uniref:tRNA(Ile)-lysidine synthase n=1 Tax=Sediminihabitans luteus TaxID=1138585 RepID=A0A2M9CEG7_9CELL|nr:tRNA lysidine(34) synthetase TilS [Sediminihabitans luteus]PJJ70245.1 tRNA(Ile)-lysidine synthase [Sediminihabitans luteus]GII97716.1 hypothetical protein Slu03_00940 [Sediminihabitans luteus]
MAGPHPAEAAARAAVRDALADLAPGADPTLPRGTVAAAAPLVLVACSGGADSLALAAAAGFAAPRLGLRAGAVVVDHGLQPGSDAVAARAAAQCRALGLDPVEVRAVEVAGARAGGPEAAARTARYAALDAAAQEHDAVAVLLGHTLDDQAESVLLGLARGSGARSLAGIAPVRGRLRRPLLGMRRAETEAVCAARGLDPWHDPTNGPGTTGLPRRSRVRHEVLPVLAAVLGPDVVLSLARTADLLRDDADLLDHLAADLLDQARRAASDVTTGATTGAATGAAAGGAAGADVTSATSSAVDGAVVLDAAALAGAPPALRRRALRAAALAAGSPPGSLFAVHVDALDALVLRWRGQGPVDLPGGRQGARACGTLVLGPRPPGSAPASRP